MREGKQDNEGRDGCRGWGRLSLMDSCVLASCNGGHNLSFSGVWDTYQLFKQLIIRPIPFMNLVK